MKTKYQQMTKEEKKQLKTQYKKTSEGKEICKKLNCSLIFIILSLISSTYLIIDTYLNKRNIFYYFYAGGLIIIVLIFCIIYIKTYQKILNNYAIKTQTKK